MQTKKVTNLFFVLLLLMASTSFFVNISTADDEQNDIIYSTFVLSFETGTSLDLNVTMDVRRIDAGSLDEEIYTKSEIIDLWNSLDEGGDVGGSIKRKLGDDLNKHINPLFIDTAHIDKTSLQNNPIFDKNDSKFHADFCINLTSSFFGLDKNITTDDLITGLLDEKTGAILKYDFELHAEKGWSNTFIFDLSSTAYRATDDGSSFSGGKFPIQTWIVNNTNGDDSKSEMKNLYVKPEDASIVTEEDIYLNHKLDSSDPEKTKLITYITMRNISVDQYSLPDFISYVNIIPSDGVRLLVDYELFSWNKFYQKSIEPIREKIIKYIENSSLKQKLHLDFEWNVSTTTNCPQTEKYNTKSMNSKPAIKSKFTDSEINLTIFNITSKAFFGLINAGADAKLVNDNLNFGENLSKIISNYDVSFYLPKNMTIRDNNPYVWNENNPVEGDVSSDIKNNYSKEKKETIIEIDLQNPRLNIISFITGNTELEFDAKIKESRNYYVSNISNQSEYFPIPEKISLDYLCSDAFRLCVEENVFSDENMSGFLQNEKNIFRQRTAGLWPGLKVGKKAKVNIDAFEKSLNAEESDIFEMDEYPAINVKNDANIMKAIRFDLGFLPPSFEIEKQNFNIKSLKDQNITYRIIFPDGIDVKVKNNLGEEKPVRKTKDGRTIVEFKFNDSENITGEIQCKLQASSLFILGMFLPCILTFIVAIILVVLLIFIRRKKGGRSLRDLLPRRSKKEEFEDENYEDEEFYVPPPPEGKK